MNLATVLHEYGYPAVFFGVMLEGESVLLAAAYGIHRHFLAWWPVVVRKTWVPWHSPRGQAN